MITRDVRSDRKRRLREEREWREAVRQQSEIRWRDYIAQSLWRDGRPVHSWTIEELDDEDA